MRLVIFRQAKHGQGCSTTAAMLATITASTTGAKVAFVCNDDTAPDVHALFGVPRGDFDEHQYTIADGSLAIVHASIFEALHATQHFDYVIVDAGVGDVPSWAHRWVLQASVWVTMPCYLALYRAQAVAPIHRHVLRSRPGSALTPKDVARSLGCSSDAECVIENDSRISRAVDAGLLSVGAAWRYRELAPFQPSIWFDTQEVPSE